MNLSREQRLRLIADTWDAARALLEDIRYVRSLVERGDYDSAELRRASAVLRRMLIDGTLRAVAAPRIGKVCLDIPGYHSYYEAEQKVPIGFFGAIDQIIVFSTRVPVDGLDTILGRKYGDNQPAPTYIPVNVDRFNNQRIICFHGKWVTRAEIIKHIANIRSGVHSNTPEPGDVMEEIRKVATLLKRDDGKPGLFLHHSGNQFFVDPPGITPAPYNPLSVDPLLAAILATMRLLDRSKSLRELEEFIDRQIRLRPNA